MTPLLGANHLVTPAPETETASINASGPDDIDYDAADFAAALASFDREQAEDKAAASAAMEEDKVVTGTVVKITDKYVVVDINLKERRPDPEGAGARPHRRAKACGGRCG